MMSGAAGVFGGLRNDAYATATFSAGMAVLGAYAVGESGQAPSTKNRRVGSSEALDPNLPQLAGDAGDAIKNAYEFAKSLRQFRSMKEVGELGQQAREQVGYKLNQPGRRFGANLVYQPETPGELSIPPRMVGIEFPVAPGTHVTSFSVQPLSYHYLELVGTAPLEPGITPRLLQNSALPVATHPSQLGLRREVFIPVRRLP